MEGCPRKYPQLNRELLWKLYWEDEKPAPQISRELHIPTTSIRNYLKYFAIPIRSCREAHGIAIKQGVIRGAQVTLLKEELYKLYWKDKKSLFDIALPIGSSADTVARAMRKYGIPVRGIRERNQLIYDQDKRLKRKRFVAGNGYVRLFKPDYPQSDKRGYVMEHRFVLEQKLGRPLNANEVGHHLNGMKRDNRPENLISLSRNGERGHHGYLVMQAQQKRIRELEATLEH